MHEFAICRALVGQLEAVARDNGAARVTGLTVKIGPLSGVVPELLASAFPVAAAGSLAEGARLSIDTAPLRVWCPGCKLESEAEINRLVCVRCGTWRTELRSGDELLLKSVVVEDDPPAREPWEGAHV
ncbi:hydrogenase maturation nickel metallochaperone HypA/HybF [Tropicimonas aquimaris]|uniref:Hydrogenase maturation factor HypA n=1 Tax=Tropicimonas aquimaris TaxID=914152 RepID=A0ABW3IV52_9RHOB